METEVMLTKTVNGQMTSFSKSVRKDVAVIYNEVGEIIMASAVICLTDTWKGWASNGSYIFQVEFQNGKWRPSSDPIPAHLGLSIAAACWAASPVEVN